jgi:uncharacterized protein (DUF2461 family)
MATFSGFSPAAVDFYERLERNNTRQFWADQKTSYERFVRDPMRDLLEELEREFGRGKVFRPNRDTRFSANKAPFKTHQGAFVEGAVGGAPEPPAGSVSEPATGQGADSVPGTGSTPGTGYYVEISARGLLAGGGFHAHSSGQTARYRVAVADDQTGAELESIVADLVEKDFDVEGERVKTAPRGYTADHPRIELLRYKELMVFRRFGTPAWLDTPRALDEVRETWRALRPLAVWVAMNAPAD